MQSRFKSYLVDHENLPREAEGFREWWDFYFQYYQSQKLTAAEWVFCVLAEWMETRKPGKWWIKSSPALHFLSRPESFGIFQSRPHFQKMGVLSPSDFFNRYSFKKLPGGIAALLCRWSQGHVHLELRTTAVTPLQMLELQAQRKRVITLASSVILKGQLADSRRDGLEFLLHDLMHAHHFFSETHNQQVDFFAKLLNCFPLFAEAMEQDPVFAKELEYIMSDMNTNINHLRMSLRAALIDKERRKEELLSCDKLSELGEQRWQEIFVRF